MFIKSPQVVFQVLCFLGLPAYCRTVHLREDAYFSIYLYPYLNIIVAGVIPLSASLKSYRLVKLESKLHSLVPSSL